MNVQCKFCKNEFNTRKYMLKHQRNSKACIEIQQRFNEPKDEDILNPNDLKKIIRNNGYVNLTILCQSGGEQYKRWIRMTRVTQKVLPDLSIKLKKPKSELIKTIGAQTWGHPDIVPDIIKWMTDLRRKRIARASVVSTNIPESEDGESKEEESKDEDEDEDEDEDDEDEGNEEGDESETTPPSSTILTEVKHENILTTDTTFKLKLLNNEILDISIRKDGYINATQLCKAGNKLFGHYQKSKQTQDYLQALSSIIGIPILDLLDSKVGGSHSGTYVHRKVAYHLAQWISPHFAVQVSNVLDELMLTGRVELGKEKTNAELEDIFQTTRLSLDYQQHLGKDVLYFFEFTPDIDGLKDPTLLDNKELHFFEFGVSSNIQQRVSGYGNSYRLDKVFEYTSGFKTSLAEKYTKNIVLDLDLKLCYKNKMECFIATYNDLDKLYELISKHLIRSREDNDMCDYEIEKMRLENERMKLSLLEKRVLTYDQMKEMFGNSIL